MERYLLVALGGALGSALRYGLGAWVQALTGPRAFLYVVFSVFLGLFLVLLGYRLGGALVA
ncbi:hypothetical protein CSW39_01635 [Thermus scotoductus]|uniref:hypothetical protein n=1 Tax=Thermus scotoductus TaxID=37636 RepID=UPI000F80B7D7|nr:hypothetical protein [Thermus scotoductus]RTH19842.1 hypothetical protein CSW39_01635 [Thermus scotoductus]